MERELGRPLTHTPVACVLAVLLAWVLWTPSAGGEAPPVVVWGDGRLDVSAENAPLFPVEALGYVGGPIATEALAAGAGDREPAVRMAALRTLALHVRDEAAKLIVEQSLLDQDAIVCARALDLLAHWGGGNVRRRATTKEEIER